MGAIFFTSVFLTCEDAKNAQAEGIASLPRHFVRFKMSDSEDRIVKMTMPDETTQLYFRESDLRRALDSLK